MTVLNKKPTILMYPMYLWGHIMPMRGMMKEFARRGHRVIVYATDDFKDVIEETGAHYVSCNDVWGDRPSTNLSLTDVFVDQIPLRDFVENNFKENMARYASAIAIIDQAFLCGKQAAKKTGMPFVVSAPTIPFNKISVSYFWEDVFKHMDSYSPDVQEQIMELRNVGFGENSLDFLLTLDEDTDCVTYITKSFLPTPELYSLEHLFFAGTKGETDEKKEPNKRLPGLPQKKTRPFVFVTMGTTGSYNPFFWMNCIRAFKDKDVDVVMILWKYLDKDMFADVPDNVKLIVEGDQKEYLKQADLMVCHGGLNTISDGLWAGVPMVLFPLVADQFQNCRIVEGLHAGITLDNYKAESISAAVDKLLSDESYRKSAAAMGEEMRQSGTTEELCDWILERHAQGGSVYPKVLSFQQCDMMEKYERYKTARGLMNVGFVMDFPSKDGVRGVYALMRALHEFVGKNDGARIRISESEALPGIPTQQFRGTGYMPDIRILHFKERDNRYKGFLTKCWATPLDLGEGVFSFWIAVFENGEFSLVAVFDHVNTDQYALSLASDSIKKLYTQILNGEEPAYAPPSFVDFIDRQSDYLLSKRYKRDLDYWRRYLKGLCDLPPDEEKELSDDFSIYRINRISKAALLDETAKRFDVSTDTFVFALYAILCGKYLKRKELYIIRRYLNRIHKEDMSLFANCRAELPVHVRLSGEKTFKELCLEIQHDSIISQRHGGIPVLELEKVVLECAGGNRDIPFMPGFGVGSERFLDITKAFSRPESADRRETTLPLSGIEDKDLDFQLEQNPDGSISLSLRGRTGRLFGCAGFDAFADELFALCERLHRYGDMELKQLKD